jgi:hypothetical protein
MTIIEYKLHSSPKGMQIPKFVTDGGHFKNPDDFTLIGTVPDGVEYYIPDSVVVLTPAELEERQLAIHAKYPVRIGRETDEREMTDDEVRALVADWVNTR